jgi:transcriptional regulator with XRE-family HTH domain
MKQQDILRQAMAQSGQTRAQLAGVMGVAKRTLDKWLLPESSRDFRHMPETALRLLANQYGVRKSADLSMPYDWPNPAMNDGALILNVLRRANFPDLVRICADYGLEKVRASTDAALALVPVAERGILARILARMLRSIEIALSGELQHGRTPA